MKLHNVFKIIAGTLVVVGIVLGFFERKYAPHVIGAEDSPYYPEWLSSLGWWLPSIAAIVYVLIDIFAVRSEKRHKKSNSKKV